MLLSQRCFDEDGRIASLKRYQVLDTPVEPQFERVIALVKQVFSVPMCAISLVDRSRQWFKAQRGLPVRETSRDVAFCDYTIRTAAPLAVNNAQLDRRFQDNPLVLGPPFIKSYLGVPLTSPDGYNIGSLCFIDTAAREIGSADADLLTNFGLLVMELLELREVASVDDLTGALARRAWLQAAEREVVRSRQLRRSLSVAILDVDHFKSINDRFGHPVGDEVLRLIARACMDGLRRGDCFGRIGGEEFAILFPDADPEEAMSGAERLRVAINAIRWPGSDTAGPLSASFGIATKVGALPNIAALISRADNALYQAKSAGRNKCMASTDNADAGERTI